MKGHVVLVKRQKFRIGNGKFHFLLRADPSQSGQSLALSVWVLFKPPSGKPKGVIAQQRVLLKIGELLLLCRRLVEVYY